MSATMPVERWVAHTDDLSRGIAVAAFVTATVSGDLHRAEALLARAGAGMPDEMTVEAATAAAALLLHGDGDVDTAHRLGVRALRDAVDRGERSAADAAARTLLQVCLHAGRSELWAPLIRDLRFLDDPERRRIGAAVALADPVRVTAAQLEGLDGEIDEFALRADSMGIVRVAMASVFVDRLPRCRQALRRVDRDGIANGEVAAVVRARVLLAFDAFATGQWDEALRLALSAGELSAARGYGLLGRIAQIVQACVSASRGEADAAEALADGVMAWAAPRGARNLCTEARYAGVLASLARSDFESAYRLASAISPVGELPVYRPQALWVMLDLVEAALCTDRRAEACAHVRALDDAGVARVSARSALLVGAAKALVAPDTDVVELFERALSVDGAARWPFDHARVQLLYGERLRRLRRTAGARDRLAAAMDVFRQLGAVPWGERAAKELRAAGQLPRGAHAAAPAVLTHQEFEIATLAAGGLSNKEIAARLHLSHRTVGAHLYRLFPKLGITSRAALRDALEGRRASAGR